MSLTAAVEASRRAAYQPPTANERRQAQLELLTSMILPWHPDYEVYSKPDMRVSIDLLIKMYLEEQLDGTTTSDRIFPQATRIFPATQQKSS